jgi:hypothetical protein
MEEKAVAITKHARSRYRLLWSIVVVLLCAVAIASQRTNDKCRPSVIPVESEPPPKIVVDPPLAEPLARGVTVIQYCAENLHIVPVFGSKALAVTPRVGHLHVRVDDASWVWAEAGGNPIILMGLAPGTHRVSIDLVNANHQTLDNAEVTFVIPGKVATQTASETAKIPVASSEKVVRASPRAARQKPLSHHHPK